MRKLLLFTACLLCLSASAYDLGRITASALQSISQGYVQYGVEQMKKGLAANEVMAQYYLGCCYEHGIGIAVAADEAFAMYRRAAERGLPQGMLALSRCYRQGIGVAQNAARAAEWQRRYEAKAGVTPLPDIVEVYKQGTAYPQNYALNPNATAGETQKPVLAAAPTVVVVRQQPAVSPQPVVSQPAAISPTPQPRPQSDVDTGIPAARVSRDDVFALVIANENYQDVAPVENALNDGAVFAAYCRTALGLPEKNVHLVKDATLGNIKREINLIRQIAEAYGGKATFIVYYAGHGVPDERTRGAYLLSVDGFAADLTTCYSLSDLYAVLGKMPSAKTVVLLDACFSGATRQGGMLASVRGVAIKPKACVPSGNTLVIASASGDETAYSYKEKGHGLFTYFLLRKMKENGGSVKLGELVEYVRDNVAKQSLVVNGKPQTPTATPSQSVGAKWEEWGVY